MCLQPVRQYRQVNAPHTLERHLMTDLIPGLHVVIGAGPVGSAIATQLVAQGAAVRVITRSGTTVPGASAMPCDAADSFGLRNRTLEAAVIYNAANPSQYHRWQKVWPPIAASALSAAEHSGAVLATVSNLYAYGPVDAPLHEDLPLRGDYPGAKVRAQMWLDALAAHEAGRVRAVEVRASSYIGGGSMSYTTRIADALGAGKTPSTLGRVDQPHSWTYTADTARTLIAAANGPAAHGKVWHVPTNEPRTQQQVADDLASAAGLPTPVELRTMPLAVMKALRPFVPFMRPLLDTQYQFRAPFIIDDSMARAHLNIEPTPWEQIIDEIAPTQVRVDA
jgi:nucleoside-diphosphate-sugar epimerase